MTVTYALHPGKTEREWKVVPSQLVVNFQAFIILDKLMSVVYK